MSPVVHMIVGSAVVLLYLLNLIMYGIQMFKGVVVSYHRLVSISAATGLLIQYALGFMLLGGGNKISWTHWVVALLAIVPVGMEHGMTANETSIRKRSTIGLMATVLTFAAVLAAYAIAEMA